MEQALKEMIIEAGPRKDTVMGMVERVARAMARVEAEKRDRDEGGRGDGIDWLVSHTWRLLIQEARAAIEAMREPTEEMIDAAERVGGHSLYRYQAMIDKAIQESGE